MEKYGFAYYMMVYCVIFFISTLTAMFIEGTYDITEMSITSRGLVFAFTLIITGVKAMLDFLNDKK
jgi:hypothetical protein